MKSGTQPLSPPVPDRLETEDEGSASPGRCDGAIARRFSCPYVSALQGATPIKTNGMVLGRGIREINSAGRFARDGN